MPVYESACKPCGLTKEYLRQVADCLDTPECPVCGEKMSKVILTAPKGYVAGKFDAFVSTVDGTVISSKRGLAEHNARNNVVSLADGYSDEAIASGSYTKRKEVVFDEKERADDIASAIYDVSNGYKPEVRYDEEN
jgi:putative FmdB family regulatory protein